MNDTPLLLTIGAQVRKHRKALRMSQEELALSCGMFRTYLSRIEGGTANPTVQVLESLAIALSIDITVLFDASA
jgi:transcriptional regulator with XRE-family HTH domain